VSFTLDEARALLPDVLAQAQRIIELRADLSDGKVAMQEGRDPPGGLPHLKSLEAHLQEVVEWFAERDIQLKGLAPIIIDFASDLDGRPVLLCWLEGETALDWYHPLETGFMGRRRLPGR
jgi:hypothetical protein